MEQLHVLRDSRFQITYNTMKTQNFLIREMCKNAPRLSENVFRKAYHIILGVAKSRCHYEGFPFIVLFVRFNKSISAMVVIFHRSFRVGALL